MNIVLSMPFSKELFFAIYIQACKHNILKSQRNLDYIAKVIHAHLGTHVVSELRIAPRSCLLCLKSAHIAGITLEWHYLSTHVPKTSLRALFAHLMAISESTATNAYLQNIYFNITKEVL